MAFDWVERELRRTDDPLAQVVAEFKAGRFNTPEAVTSGWQLRWKVWGERVGLSIAVPAFPGDQKDLNEHLSKGDMPFCVPRELSSQGTRHLLGRIWPAMKSPSVSDGNSVTNEVDHSGWRYTEGSTDAPYLDTEARYLTKNFKKAGRGREGLTATEYIIASQDHYLLTGEYFDQNSTWSRLLRSQHDGGMVLARFVPSGSLFVYEDLVLVGRRAPGVGGRSSVGVKRA